MKVKIKERRSNKLYQKEKHCKNTQGKRIYNNGMRELQVWIRAVTLDSGAILSAIYPSSTGTQMLVHSIRGEKLVQNMGKLF